MRKVIMTIGGESFECKPYALKAGVVTVYPGSRHMRLMKDFNDPKKAFEEIVETDSQERIQAAINNELEIRGVDLTDLLHSTKTDWKRAEILKLMLE